MKKVWKFLVSTILCLLLVFASVACGEQTSDNQNDDDKQQEQEDDEQEEQKVIDTRDRGNFSLSALTEYTYYLGPITGVGSENYTSKTGVAGTDLGFPVYDESKDRMYYVFGDTNSNYQTENYGLKHTNTESDIWRSNVIGYVDNFTTSNFENTHKFTGWLTNENGLATPFDEGIHISMPNSEGTKIPTGGIFINNTFYIFYMSIQRFSSLGGRWFVNYSGVVKSTDDGKTWSRVYDLTWFSNEEQGEISYNDFANLQKQTTYSTFDSISYNNTILALANTKVIQSGYSGWGTKEEMDTKIGQITSSLKEGNLTTVEGRVAPNFMQITPVDGKDGYIYIFGIQGGREDGMQMGRVLKENFEKFDEYEYFTGYDSSNNPIWKTYKEGGLDYISDGVNINSLSNYESHKNKNENNKSFIISSQPCGETTVFYNTYLQKWVMTSNYMNEIYMYVSSKITGPYTKRQIIYNNSYDISKQESFSDNDYDYAKVCETYGGRSNVYMELYSGFGHEKMCTDDGKMYIVISYMDRVYNSYLLEVQLY